MSKIEAECSPATDCYDELASFIARGIMIIGDEGQRKAWRVQFMLGFYGSETPAGGLNENALKNVIATLLRSRDHFSS
tara:strand:- start:168 stop:401 length:234 start_codon:yes stop_codon:yes gene_type:complete